MCDNTFCHDISAFNTRNKGYGNRWKDVGSFLYRLGDAEADADAYDLNEFDAVREGPLGVFFFWRARGGFSRAPLPSGEACQKHLRGSEHLPTIGIAKAICAC